MFSRDRRGARSGDDDFIIIGIAVSVLLVLAALGNGYFELARLQIMRLGAHNSSLVTGLLLLNAALTIYGWRRYRDVKHEVSERRLRKPVKGSVEASDWARCSAAMRSTTSCLTSR